MQHNAASKTVCIVHQSTCVEHWPVQMRYVCRVWLVPTAMGPSMTSHITSTVTSYVNNVFVYKDVFITTSCPSCASSREGLTKPPP